MDTHESPFTPEQEQAIINIVRRELHNHVHSHGDPAEQARKILAAAKDEIGGIVTNNIRRAFQKG